MKFENISFKKKIFILIAIPLLSFIYYSISSISQSISSTQEMTQLTRLANLSVVYSDLVHELQKERGMTAGFLTSKGTKFTNKLINQRQEVNNKDNLKTNYLRENVFENGFCHKLPFLLRPQCRHLIVWIQMYNISTASPKEIK